MLSLRFRWPHWPHSTYRLRGQTKCCAADQWQNCSLRDWPERARWPDPGSPSGCMFWTGSEKGKQISSEINSGSSQCSANQQTFSRRTVSSACSRANWSRSSFNSSRDRMYSLRSANCWSSRNFRSAAICEFHDAFRALDASNSANSSSGDTTKWSADEVSFWTRTSSIRYERIARIWVLWSGYFFVWIM